VKHPKPTFQLVDGKFLNLTDSRKASEVKHQRKNLQLHNEEDELNIAKHPKLVLEKAEMTSGENGEKWSDLINVRK